jgi:hypothetical protein
MKTINLDQFRESVSVKIAGKSYTIDIFSMGELANLEAKIRSSDNDYHAYACELLMKHSDISQEVFDGLQPKQQGRLLGLAQGADPERLELEQSGDSGKK